MLQPIFGFFIGVALGAAREHDHIETFGAQEELMCRMRHDLTAEIPEMHRQVIVLEIRNAREDARLLLHFIRGKRGVLDGDTLRHRLLALDYVLAMERVDQRSLTGLAVPDEDRPDAFELLGERTVTKPFEISVDFGRALRKLLLR